MAFNQAAMSAFADYTVANCNGRYQDLAGRDLNVDGRFGYQCMDLFIWFRYRLGFFDNLPTPTAAAVWEMNWTDPGSTMWQVFDGITPDQPAMPGDTFIMNRGFFGNGVGHIGTVLADLGDDIRVLELNGLGDGYEDDNGGQHGSPARIHVWPKTYLYGYLRWIGPTPAVSGQAIIIEPIVPTPPKEDTLSAAEVNTILKAIGSTEAGLRKYIADHMLHGTVSGGTWRPGATALAIENQRRINTANAGIGALESLVEQLAKKNGTPVDYDKITASINKALADGIEITGTIAAKDGAK
ncbi:hypothetical protein ART_0159 [Arthrobacter sp. PAMC 25486]|uniref:hypothetical protein n=1 Tax=Arthrobacter sp. PAMC 25486 TaxID=1494608 RepID=UPI000535E1C3|nr:hypothetical protein [Arthrobacter sp. PAMC 25486]AIX99757.1 hypothetical protein ART_0159 [Arthrobacter sp. PAMC 25486]